MNEVLSAELVCILLCLLSSGIAFWLLANLSGLTSMARNFDRRWPPISEDEFIARCHAGVDRDKALRVRRIVSKQLGIPYDQIYPEQSFVNDLGCG